VGKQKTEEAKKALASLNPEVDVQVVSRKLQQDELEKLVPQASVVLDCSDNFATRHAVNRACVRHRKPLVSGAAIRFDAQLMVFDLRRPDAPCYACLFPEDGEVEEVQCSTMGVFAPLTGVIGALQAMEAIKLVAGVGESSAARLQVFDAKSAEWRSVKVPKDSACAVCSAAP
jgi:molybdopterin/thiamine biosynthesis adenylyltransferase